MEKLKTNELSLGLNQTLRNDLVDNFDKIQNGVDGQADGLNKQILDMLGDVPLQNQNEVTQARIDRNGKPYNTLKGREDATQATAETSLLEERATSVEVKSARINHDSKTYKTLKERLDEQENDLTNSINDKISRINVVPETFANLITLKNAYPNGKVGLFVTADTGHKFIWSNNAWVDAGVYQAVGIDFNIDGVRQYNPIQKIGGVSPFDGSIDNNINAAYFEINVNNINRVGFYTDSFTSNYGYAFYDENDKFIPGSGILGSILEYKMINVPVTAKTFRTTNHLETHQIITLSANNSLNEINNDFSKKIYNEVFGNKKLLNLKKYDSFPLLISRSTGRFTRVGNSSSVLIPITEIGKAFRIKAGNEYEPLYAFLKTNSIIDGGTPSYSDGYTGTNSTPLNATETIITPKDANYLFVSNTLDDGRIHDTTPEFINPMMDTLVTIAAENSSKLDKLRADYICTGINDETVFNDAIKTLVYGGTIKLFDGEYYIDSFNKDTYAAVYFENNGQARTINFEGSTENKSNLSRYGVSIHVTQKAFDKMPTGRTCNVFLGSDKTITIGQWWGFSVNVNFKNFYLFLATSTIPCVGINSQYFGSSFAKQVGIYSEDYFNDRFDRHKPVTPSIDSIGIVSVNDANDEMARIGMDTVNVGGLGIGIIVARAEHLILKNCTVSRSVIGYAFYGDSMKPLTLINNADEGNRHLPLFRGSGLITSIDFSIERFDETVIPDDPRGDIDPFAKEIAPDSWKGSFEYNIQGSALGVNRFWKDGSGKNIKTTKIGSPKQGVINPSNPDFLQEFYRTDLKKKIIYDGVWYDNSGNIVI